MSDPLFDSRTSRFELPLLFAGQAQKEFYVNEAHGLIDALLHMVLEGARTDPPAAPLDGEAWRIAGVPTGEWTGQSGKIAVRQAGAWIFVAPCFGMSAFDKTSGCQIRYDNGWSESSRPSSPNGGTIIDAEARQAVNQIIAALTSAGIVAPG